MNYILYGKTGNEIERSVIIKKWANKELKNIILAAMDQASNSVLIKIPENTPTEESVRRHKKIFKEISND